MRALGALVVEGGRRYFVFRRGRLLVRRGAIGPAPFSSGEWPELQPLAETVLPMGGNDTADFAVELEQDFVAGADFDWAGLRSLVGVVGDDQFNLWGKAAQILHWHKTHRYCGQCGGHTEIDASLQAAVCPACSLTWYPRISPCVIVLVTRGEELLLARSPRFREGMYSTLAGFIEPGESAESALHREVEEEVAIRIGNIRYFGSQPWPFPGQLMLGFFAEYESGEIAVDREEISDAGWYHYRSLPPIPGEGAIAGRMIRQHLHLLSCGGGGAATS